MIHESIQFTFIIHVFHLSAGIAETIEDKVKSVARSECPHNGRTDQIVGPTAKVALHPLLPLPPSPFTRQMSFSLPFCELAKARTGYSDSNAGKTIDHITNF